MNRSLVCSVAAGGLLLAAAPVLASGILVPPDGTSIAGLYTIPHQRISMTIDGQICKTQVQQAFRNPTGRTLEVEYFFPLPDDAAIDSFVMMVDGKEMPGRLLDKDQARRIYEAIVRKQRDPALLEYMGRGVFKTSVFPIPPGQQRDIHLSFTRLSRRDGNVIDILYPLATARFSAQPIGELSIDCRITAEQPIKSVYSPSHEINVSRPGERIAEVSLRQHGVLPQSDFALMYTVSDAAVGLSVLSYRPSASEPGYFLLLASPKIDSAADEILPKTVIFVLDKSGSMTGEKIEQAKRALKFVIRNLNPGDTFNIVTYDAAVEQFAPELQAANSATVEQALGFVERISAGGSTNIDGALRTAMSMLTAREHPTYIIFLTDGLPTAGEQRPAAIVDNCSQANRVRAHLMAFGVGDDVNARLLDKLVASNHGATQYVRPQQDIEEPVSTLFRRLSTPVLSEVTLHMPGLDPSLTYPKELPDVFKGQQMVIVGRYHQSGPVEVSMHGKVAAQQQRYQEGVVLDDRQAPYARAFVEKLWAERRIGHLIDEIDLHGRNQELIDEIVRLSTRHGILTPYTSFLADENTVLADVGGLRRRTSEQLDLLQIEGGAAGVGQRILKGRSKSAVRPAPAGLQAADSAVGGSVMTQTVLSLGTKTFYRRTGVWVEGTLTPRQLDDAVRLLRYSDEYFDVLRRLPADMTRYFALDGEVVVAIGDRVYRIVYESPAP